MSTDFIDACDFLSKQREDELEKESLLLSTTTLDITYHTKSEVSFLINSLEKDGKDRTSLKVKGGKVFLQYHPKTYLN
ncbi:hypothetical protein BKN14_04370 [Candidatus Gracilibacteria bacterium HOT-871]|nr:hypothetical protein BKN14_04370 [Candidatus Gracilibacteria bacterium HOT-871]MBB1564986.1 hypothetical protein [Candidatus Gracilibacteria bacterium]MBF0913611.1 hypothetical protein [Candidatus Gracilibacteria bacterium]RKW22542.1 MAG: hypothetical protein D8B46_05235 [Candidatus Gracilibacteria bacterium]